MDMSQERATFDNSGASDETPIFSFTNVWVSLLRRRWIIFAFMLLGLAAGFTLSLRSRKFTSEGMLRIEPSRSSMYQLSASQALGGDSSLDAKLNTEVIVMTSDGLLLRVAKDLDLANKPEFYPKAAKEHQILDAPKTRDSILLLMKKALIVQHVPKSEVVSIAATTHSATLSANLINTLINDYISDVLEVRFGSTQRVSTWLIGQLDELKGQVQSDQEELVELESRLGVLSVDPKSSTYLNADALAELSRASSEATINRILAEARYRYVKDADPNLLESEESLLGKGNESNSLLQGLRLQLAQAQADYASLTSQFGANYPPVKDAKAKVDSISKQVRAEELRIINQSKLAYSAASANEQMTTAALTGQQKEAFHSRNDLVRFAILQREYESHRQLYESLVQRLKEAGIDSGLQSAQVDIVDLAKPPSEPRAPAPSTWIVGATLFSLFLGCITAIIVDMIEVKFDSVEDTERRLRIPGLSTLPLETPADQALPFLTLEHATSDYAEGMQLVRNALLLSNPDRQPKVILVTSAWPKEGKSTIARELAAVFAQHASKVLLIDGDLRKPSQHTRIGLPRAPGLSTVVTGTSTFENAVHKIDGAPGLYVLTAGPTPPQSAVLWNSSKMRELMEYCRQEFDFVILDSAPVLSVVDGVLGVPLVDTALLVIRYHTADQRSIQRAVQLLQRAGAVFSGFVLNAVDTRWNRYMPYYNKYTYGTYGTEETKGKEGR
jgi:succinoglycan biosynthesis transport protein ExoP